jgi:hypothetical protein
MTNVVRSLVSVVVAGTLITLMGGCRPVTAPGEPGSAAAATVSVTAAADAAAASSDLSGPEQQMVDAATVQVAQTANVAASDVHLNSIEAVEWPDASLGCPQPDMMYAQVITPGYLLVFDAGGQTVEVHADSAQPPQIVICQP